MLNLERNFPYLAGTMVKGPNGGDKILHSGSDVERKVGCRNNPAWQEFRKKDIIVALEGTAKSIKDDPYFAKLPDGNRYDAMFIDNAGIVPCWCDICKKDYAQFKAEMDKKGMPEECSWRLFCAMVPAKFNKMLKETANGVGRYTMPNVTTGCNFANLYQMINDAGDSYCWELSWRHPPYGRIAPWYKRGLAASNGHVVAAVTCAIVPDNLNISDAPAITPEFTKMALAEGFATQGAYIMKGEIQGSFFPATRQYNMFNKKNQDLYQSAHMGGKVAVLVPIRNGLMLAKGDESTNALINRLMGAGLPVEVIVERDLDNNLSKNFSVIIAPDMECASDEELAALVKFRKDGGGLIISEDFASRDWHLRAGRRRRLRLGGLR